MNAKKLFFLFCIFFMVSLYLTAQQTDEKITENEAIKIAIEKCNLENVDNICRSKIPYAHLDYYEINGYDKKGRFVVGVDPYSGNILQWAKLAPYAGRDTDYYKVDEKMIPDIINSFLKKIGTQSIPADFILTVSKRMTIDKYHFHQVLYKHRINKIDIANDYILFLLNGNGEVIAYSKIDNKLNISLNPKLDSEESIKIANDFIKESKLYAQYNNLYCLSTSLKVVYDNYYFENLKWEWSDMQSLVWRVGFGDANNKIKSLDIWVDAHSGNIRGGQIFERSRPGLIGIGDNTGDIINIWKPALELMNYNTNTRNTILTETTLPIITEKIPESDIFILQTHGDTTSSSEYAALDDTALTCLTPTDIPGNNLRYVLMSSCKSGYDGPGIDFKDTFISEGANCFHGYTEYIDPDSYEEQFARLLTYGFSVNNANLYAFMIAPPDDFFSSILIIWKDDISYNYISLAPIKVTTTAPKSTFSSCTITAEIINNELANNTTAYDIFAVIKLPEGFTLAASDNTIKNIPYLEAGHKQTISWTVNAPSLLSSKKFEFDIIVFSDNLGVAIKNYSKPYNKFTVEFTSAP